MSDNTPFNITDFELFLFICFLLFLGLLSVRMRHLCQQKLKRSKNAWENAVI